TEALQVKLDELIRALGHARNELLDLEELEERDLDELKQTFIELAKKARRDRDHLQPHGPRSET
ncbi:MAG: low affinity iron permease family protein, partial [Acidobacteria bacterium]